MVENWFTEFRCDCTSMIGAECSGCPIGHYPETIEEFHDMVIVCCKLKIRQISEAIVILHDLMVSILTDDELLL